MPDLVVYAVGDSAMWGQGLVGTEKFATIVANSLSEQRGLNPKLRILAHSGAKIAATAEERATFFDKFPSLFRNEREIERFLRPRSASLLTPDERPAERLHGEINRAFPTIIHQLDRISESDGAKVDVLLINGGANDLDFESILVEEASAGGASGSEGTFLSRYDREFERVMYSETIRVLTLARARCPHAHIVVVGYYSVFSKVSRFSDMKDLFLTLSGKRSAYELLSILRVAAPAAGFLLLGLVLNKLWNDSNAQIEEAIKVVQSLSESGESRWLHWTRKAVTDVNLRPELSDIRGPGVAFAAPGFLPENCAFAGRSRIWQQFNEGSLDDDMRIRRAAACPRDELAVPMSLVRRALLRLDTPVSPSVVLQLANQLDGPTALRDALKDVITEPSINNRTRAAELLQEDADRIHITRIGSLLHPNRLGAVRIASAVEKRAVELAGVRIREKLDDFRPPASRQTNDPIWVGKSIRRFGFDPSSGIRACIAHAEPDVISLTVHSRPTSDFLASEAFLNLGSAHRWPLLHLMRRHLGGGVDLSPHFQPGTTDFFTIDVAGQIKVGDITEFLIEFSPSSIDRNARWQPESVALTIDGIDVFYLELGAVDVVETLSLHFPKTDA